MKKVFLLFIFGGLFMAGCGSSKKTVSDNEAHKNDKIGIPDNNPNANNSKYTHADIDILKYIARYKSIAQREMKEYGIPASITIAQGILESQSGKSELATRANNHFGVKCHKDWQGPKYLYDDDDLQECFRKYDNPERSYVDHSKFLAHRKRYAFLFRLPKTDYEAWAKGLKKAGYATDPSYPDKLIYLINKYNLNELDKEVLKGMSIKVSDSGKNTSKQDKKFIYEVKKGETIFTISNKFGIPVKKIQQINNLNDFDIYEGQILVLTLDENKKSGNDQTTPDNPNQPDKNNKEEEVIAEVPNINQPDIPADEQYVVKEGQTLFSIAKENNIDVDDLRIANRFDKSTEIKVGQIIRIPKDKVKNTSENILDKTETPKENISSLTDTIQHKVKQGETIYSIARNNGVEVSDLMEANHFDNSTILKVGQIILIPVQKNNEVKEQVAETKKQGDVTKEDQSTNSPVYHIVKQGETLYRIHVNYGVPVETLRKLNNLKGNNISVGQKLRVK